MALFIVVLFTHKYLKYLLPPRQFLHNCLTRWDLCARTTFEFAELLLQLFWKVLHYLVSLCLKIIHPKILLFLRHCGGSEQYLSKFFGFGSCGQKVLPVKIETFLIVFQTLCEVISSQKMAKRYFWVYALN